MIFNETFVLLRNNAIADTNKKKNNEKLIPSNDISNSLGSTANRKHPNIANLTFVFINIFYIF